MYSGETKHVVDDFARMGHPVKEHTNPADCHRCQLLQWQERFHRLTRKQTIQIYHHQLRHQCHRLHSSKSNLSTGTHVHGQHQNHCQVLQSQQSFRHWTMKQKIQKYHPKLRRQYLRLISSKKKTFHPTRTHAQYHTLNNHTLKRQQCFHH